MEEVSQEPLTYPAVRKNPQPYQFPPETMARVEFPHLQQAIERVRDRQKAQNPGQAQLIEQTYRLFYNFFLIPEGNGVAESTDQKRFSACVAHNLVHNAFYASAMPSVDDRFVAGVAQTLETTERLIQLTSRLPQRTFWSGIKAELAVVKALKRQGFQVYLPDYSSSSNGGGESDEVTQLDIKNGVDLIAVKNGSAYLIDVKSLSNVDAVCVQPKRESMEHSVVKTLKDLEITRHHAALILVPAMSPFAFQEEESAETVSPRVRLQKFCALGDGTCGRIEDDLMRLAR